MQTLTAKRFSFAEFEIDGARRLLLKDGVVVALKPKAFDLLLALVERRGEVLSKDELLSTVWANQFVEEGNLTVHISALRKALGETKKEHQFIVTVPGRGYSFVAALKDDEEEIYVESRSLSRIVVEERIEEAETETNLERAAPAKIVAPQNRSAWLTENRPVFVAAGLVIVLLLGAGIFFLRHEPRRKSSTAQIASIKRLTENGKVSVAALSPDGKLFAYAAADGEREVLRLGHTDGGEPIEIRPPVNQIYLTLKFAPDGGSLYYILSENFRDGALYRIPVFGGAPEKLRDDVRWTITFAPDGRRFAFVRDDEEKGQAFLVVADLQSSSEKIIAASPTKFGFDRYTPAWSPDGSTIAVGAATKEDGSSHEIFVVNVADGLMKPLTKQAWGGILGLAWQPDGSGLMAAVREKTSASSQLWQISFPDGEAHRAVADLNLYGAALSFSADGKNMLAVQVQQQSNIWVAPAEDLSAARQITFASLGQDNGWSGLCWMPDGRIGFTKLDEKGVSIWTMNADGTNQRQLIPSGGDNLYPSVTSDGRFIVFQSNRSGEVAIWRADITGDNLVQLTHGHLAAQPALSPDGKWIVYTANRDNTGQLWRVSIEGGEPQRLTEKEFSWIGISPDSTLIAAGYEENRNPKVALLSIEGGAPLKVFDAPRLANFRLGVRWTPDGKAITYRDWANGIWKQPLSGGPPSRLEGLPAEKLYSYGWSRDGKQFAFARGTAISDVVLFLNTK